ncbi:alpha/beta fold hydrolase [Rhizorhabdus dicambivorans]|uniref:Alpha/beta hydrolase n=1 Tax=Rhizorhabdus dicambivorans TaxID=1850238 RepID=A0A2A4FXH4_9SPHN|nr:alpha/beta hydrolase [Rhizorhabdus dicambivorans]ATE66957.1 alpha/beta hydrolase [Rhizorhabdus dicambivorans]PCE42170.1 alpha/beta hydrolase [Rhizorhabdus dicambivorans]
MVRHHLIGFSMFAAVLPALAGPVFATAPAAALPSPAAADRFVTVEGVRFRVREEGPRNAPPILLVHGFTFSLESWDGWAADLARDHRVIRFDLAGHGLSGPHPRAAYGTEARVRQLVKLMDRLGIARATIAGNSFGGLVAWNFAARYPRRIDRLVLIDSAAFSINGVTDKPVDVPPAMRAYLLDPKPAAVAFSAAAIYAHPDRLSPARLDQMRAMIVGNGPALIAHLEQFTLPDPLPGLGRIKAPTLILWGRADKVIPVAQAEQIAAAIPGAKLVIYDDVGHAPQEEATAASLSDLRTFLNQSK